MIQYIYNLAHLRSRVESGKFTRRNLPFFGRSVHLTLLVTVLSTDRRTPKAEKVFIF